MNDKNIDPILAAAMQRQAVTAEVQQVAQAVFTHLKPRFMPGYEITMIAVHPDLTKDVVVASTSSSREGLMPAALWFHRHIMQKIDRITAAGEAVRTDAPEVAKKPKGGLPGVVPPDLAVVIRAAIPFINPRGSDRALDMLKVALAAHGGAVPLTEAPAKS